MNTPAYVAKCGSCSWRATVDPDRCERPRAFANELARAHVRDSPACQTPTVTETRAPALAAA